MTKDLVTKHLVKHVANKNLAQELVVEKLAKNLVENLAKNLVKNLTKIPGKTHRIDYSSSRVSVDFLNLGLWTLESRNLDPKIGFYAKNHP